MALRNLTTPTMVTLSRAWLDPEQMRPILERYPLARALLPHLAKVHESLIERHRAIFATKTAVLEIQRELAEVDAHHDRKIRGIFGILTGFAEVSDDPIRAAAYLDLREKLLPDGLRAVSRSYTHEAGEVELLRGRLDADAERMLREIPTPQGSLYDEVEAWMKLGRQIGDLEHKRGLIARTTGPGDITQADVARARNEWIRAIRTLRTSLGFDGAEPEVIQFLFRFLDHAEAKADRRQPVVTEPIPPTDVTSPCTDRGETPPDGS